MEGSLARSRSVVCVFLCVDAWPGLRGRDCTQSIERRDRKQFGEQGPDKVSGLFFAFSAAFLLAVATAGPHGSLEFRAAGGRLDPVLLSERASPLAAPANRREFVVPQCEQKQPDTRFFSSPSDRPFAQRVRQYWTLTSDYRSNRLRNS